MAVGSMSWANRTGHASGSTTRGEDLELTCSWELAPLPPLAAWTGLSEITLLPGGGLLLVERDNLTGDFAALKTLVRVAIRACALTA